jgi:hypothetical protein
LERTRAKAFTFLAGKYRKISIMGSSGEAVDRRSEDRQAQKPRDRATKNQLHEAFVFDWAGAIVILQYASRITSRERFGEQGQRVSDRSDGMKRHSWNQAKLFLEEPDAAYLRYENWACPGLRGLRGSNSPVLPGPVARDGPDDIGFSLKIPVVFCAMPYKYRAKFRDFSEIFSCGVF